MKVRHVDHVSEADPDNDKCKLLNFQLPAIEFSGGGTHTADALKQAKVYFIRLIIPISMGNFVSLNLCSSCLFVFFFSCSLFPFFLEYLNES